MVAVHRGDPEATEISKEDFLKVIRRFHRWPQIEIVRCKGPEGTKTIMASNFCVICVICG